MINKDTYIDLCKKHNISLFSQYWWLDAVVSREGWDVIILRNGSEIIGALPYCIQRFGYFFKGIYNPFLTQRTELYLNYPQNKTYQEIISFENKAINKIISDIPKTAFVSINFHHSLLNWLPFYWKNYNSSVRYSYVLDDLTDLDYVYQCFHARSKKNIERTTGNYQIIESTDIKTFYDLNKESFKRKKLRIPYDIEILISIDNACSIRNQRKLLMAFKNDVAVGGIYLVWDNNYMYYLTSGISSSTISTGVSSLLVWESIKLAAAMKKKFDFEGSMHKSIEPFFRSFSPKQQQYLNINKYNNLILKLYKALITR